MDFYILEDINLERIGMIDNVISSVWNNKYFSCGDFSIKIEATSENIELIKKNYFIVRVDVPDEIGIIETVAITEQDKEKLIVFSGRFAHSVLARRVVWGSSLLNGMLLQQLKELIKINAIECKDESGNLFPERNLINNYQIVAMIGNRIESPESSEMTLNRINAEVEMNKSGSGYKYPFQYSTFYDISFDKDVSFNFENAQGGETVYFLGNLLKNPLTGLADVIVQKGNKYIKKERNVYIGDFKSFIKNVEKNIYESFSQVQFDVNWNRDPLFSSGIIEFRDIADGKIADVEIGYSVFSPTGDSPEVYKDLGLRIDLGKNQFSDKLKIKTQRTKNDNETFLYYSDGFLWFANVLTNNDDFEPQREKFIKLLDQIPDNTQFLYSLENESEKDTGLTIDAIPSTSSYYSLTNPERNDGAISLLEMEALTKTDNINAYIELSENLPSNNSLVYEIVKGDNLLEFTEKNLQKIGLSIKAIYSREKNKITLSFYEGKDRTKNQSENDQVVFSKDLDTLTGFSATESTQGKANVSRVSGKKDDIEEWTTTGAGSGLNRYERYDDIGDLSTFAGIDHIKALQSSGEMALLGYHTVIDAEIDASLYEYRKDYYLGDIVTVDIKDLALQYDARVLEVCETFDTNQYKISLILGK